MLHQIANGALGNDIYSLSGDRNCCNKGCHSNNIAWHSSRDDVGVYACDDNVAEGQVCAYDDALVVPHGAHRHVRLLVVEEVQLELN